MFGFRLSVKCVTGVLLAGLLATGAVAAEAQTTTRRTRRESSANRKARIARTIAETYGHRYEVAGGGGYLRFQSGAPQRNNEVTFFIDSEQHAPDFDFVEVGPISSFYAALRAALLDSCSIS